MKLFIRITAALILLALILILRPVPRATYKNSAVVKDTVSSIADAGGPYDVAIWLKNDKRYFYINRGGQNGIDAAQFNKKLKGKVVSLYYSKHWTPLDPKNKVRHVTRLEYEGEVLYNEIE